MKKMIALLTILMASMLVSACSTEKSRAAECQAKGMDKQTCYLSEQIYKQQQANLIGDSVGIGIISSMVK